jgi:predicted metal-dependent hydrolase
MELQLALVEEHRQVVIGARAIPYTLKVSARAKRMRVTIANGQMSVTVPKGLRLYSVDRFLQEHGQWILAKLEQVKKQKVKPVLPKDVLLVEGVPMRVERIEEKERKSRARVDLMKDRVIVRMPAGSRTSPLAIAEDWLREQARDVISAEVNRQAALMRAKPTGLSIRDQRTRWGSCSGKGALSFNWRLVMAPPVVMQYVVIHELAHLFQPNHSKDFWAVVASYEPEYKKHRAWLRKNASLLRPQV